MASARKANGRVSVGRVESGQGVPSLKISCDGTHVAIIVLQLLFQDLVYVKGTNFEA